MSQQEEESTPSPSRRRDRRFGRKQTDVDGTLEAAAADGTLEAAAAQWADDGGAHEAGEAEQTAPDLAALEAELDEQLSELDALQPDLEAAQPAEEAVDGEPTEAKTVREQELEAQLAAAVQRADEAETTTQRIAADYQNLQRRTTDQLARAEELANESAASNLIAMGDELRRVLEHTDAGQSDPLIDGVRAVLTQLDRQLASMGVTEMELDGAVFDPNLHVAVAAEPSPDVTENTVGKVWLRGYMISSKSGDVEKVLRPAQVVVQQPLTGAPEQPEVG